jgi:hypothetical protein
MNRAAPASAGMPSRCELKPPALEGQAGAILHSLPGDEAELFFWKLADQRLLSLTSPLRDELP